MSLVDVAQSLHRRATDQFCGNRLVFHHVPKCGGTSIGQCVRRAYILSQGTVTPVESEQAFQLVQKARDTKLRHVSELREMMLLYMLYSDIRCVSAHIHFSTVAFENFCDRYAFVTMLRDPVERFVSHYLFNHNRPHDRKHIPESFEEYVCSERAKRMGSFYARYFSGDPPPERFSAGQIDAAIKNLRRMNLVGFLDEVGRFQAGLEQLTGRRLRIGKENVGGRTSGAREEIMSGQLRKKVIECCSVDLEIWNAVQDLRGREPVAPKIDT
jgi:hypothetical protein